MRTGWVRSITSTGAFDRFCEGLVMASMPSWSGRPPQQPLIMSTTMKGRRSGRRPAMQTTVLPPSPAAGSTSGTICASAPNIVSMTR